MQSFSEIIDSFGGQADFANILGTTQQNVSQMRKRNSIPSRFWPATVRAATERGIEGINYEMLATLAANRLPETASPPASEQAA